MPPERTPGGDPTELALRLRQGAAELGLVLPEPVLRRLLAMLELLRKWNAVYNLTAIRDPREMLVHHLLDSLSILPPLRRRLDLDRATIADVGSGAGLPGLPIAIVHPGARLVSIEPIGKKTAFQRQVCSELALTNVEIVTGKAESLARPVDLVTCRAFAPTDFRDELNAHLGSAFSIEPILTQSAWFRPHNRDDRVPNLYLVGAGTHPGAGIPGVVGSARATASLMLRDAGLGDA